MLRIALAILGLTILVGCNSRGELKPLPCVFSSGDECDAKWRPYMEQQLAVQSDIMMRQGLATMASRPVYTAPSSCYRGHWIDKVDDDGEIIVLEDDSIWRVSATDRFNTSLWLPVDQVVICNGGLMIDTSRHGEKAVVSQIN